MFLLNFELLHCIESLSLFVDAFVNTCIASLPNLLEKGVLFLEDVVLLKRF
jgi:hypothetical protein